jgi:hypothetical protein
LPIREYRPSGRVGWRALWAVPACVLLAIALGWGYAHVVAPQTSTVFTLIVAVVLSIVAILVLTVAGKLAHSRSQAFSTALGGLLALAMLWARWKTTLDLADLHAQSQSFAASLPFLWPQRLWASLPALQESTRSTLGIGWVVLGCGVEALALVWACAWTARISATELYSESAHAWAKQIEKRDLAWAGDEEGVRPVRALLDRYGVDTLLSRKRLDEPPSQGMSAWVLEVACHQVEADAAARWLTIRRVKVVRDAPGGPKREPLDVVDGWQVDASDFDALVAHLRQPVSLAAPAVGEPSPGWGPESPDVPAAERRPDPPELKEAIAALEAGDFPSVVELATAFRDSADAALRADALRLCALGHSRLAQWTRAFEDFEALFALDPSPLDALQLATTSVMAGELARGQAWFDKACELQPEHGEPPMARLHTGFISALTQAGEFQAAVPHLEWLRGAWPVLGSTDDTRAWMAGLPFFGEFLARSQDILRRSMPLDEVIAWYMPLRDVLDADGIAQLDPVLAALRLAEMKG